MRERKIDILIFPSGIFLSDSCLMIGSERALTLVRLVTVFGQQLLANS